MGDYSVPGSSSGSCIGSGGMIYSTALHNKGTMFFKNDPYGYSARQFKSSINSIEEVMVKKDDGSIEKQLFALSDRGLYYIDENDHLNRVKIPLANLRIPFIDINNRNELVDSLGARYTYNSDTQVFEKSIVDNEGNKTSLLGPYIDKVKYNTVHISNYDMDCYLISDGDRCYYLFENYNGDRTWQVKTSDFIVSLFNNPNVGSSIYGIDINGKLNIFSLTNRTWVKYLSFSNVNNAVLNENYNVSFIATYKFSVGNNKYLFLYIIQINNGIYYTLSDNSTLQITNGVVNDIFIKLNSFSSDVIFNHALYQESTNTLWIGGNKRLYYINQSCITKNVNPNNETDITYEFTIKTVDSNDLNCRRISIDNNDIYVTVQNNKIENKILESSPTETQISSISSLCYRTKSAKNDSTRGKYLKLGSDSSRQINSYYVPKRVKVFKKKIYNIETIDSITLYKVNNLSNVIQLTNTNITSNIVVNKKRIETYLKEIYYRVNKLKKVDTDKYIEELMDSEYRTIRTGEYFNFLKLEDVEYISQLYSDSNMILQNLEESNSIYNTYQISQNNTVLSNYKTKNIINNNEIRVKTINNIKYVATCCGVYKFDSRNKLNDDVLIDITGNTNFREMYEIEYTMNCDYTGQWFVFTTSDGLINCKAGIPTDPNWDPQWNIFKHGLGFYKIRFTSKPKQFDDESKKSGIIIDGNFSVKYPSYE